MICSKCKTDKPSVEYNTYKYKPKKDGSQTVGVRSYCKSCQYNYTKKFFKKNPEYKSKRLRDNPDIGKKDYLKRKEKMKDWVVNNRERHNKSRADYRKRKGRDSDIISSKRAREDLRDSYVIQQIIKRSILTASDMVNKKELIEAYRIQIKTKRLCKTLQS